jgi:hypothetical protein
MPLYLRRNESVKIIIFMTSLWKLSSHKSQGPPTVQGHILRVAALEYTEAADLSNHMASFPPEWLHQKHHQELEGPLFIST